MMDGKWCINQQQVTFGIFNVLEDVNLLTVRINLLTNKVVAFMTTFDTMRDRLRSAPVLGMFISDEERNCLEQETNELLARIAECSSFELADCKLLELGEIQHVLAILLFKYKLTLSHNQEELVRAYDRWDDADERRRTFDHIIQGRFPRVGDA